MSFRVVHFLLLFALITLTLCCKKIPPKTLNHGKKQNGDNGYRLVIGSNPKGYEPGKIYNCECKYSHYLSLKNLLVFFSLLLSVFLVGSRDYTQLQQFTHFMITAEAINIETNRTSVAGPKRVGRFQLFGDALTKFYEQCVNTVAEADDLPKTEVQVSFFSII